MFMKVPVIYTHPLHPTIVLQYCDYVFLFTQKMSLFIKLHKHTYSHIDPGLHANSEIFVDV